MSSTGAPPGDLSPDTSTRINATIGIAAFVVIFGCVAFFITLDLCLRVLMRRYTGIIPLGIPRQQGTGGAHVNLLNKGLDQAVIERLLPVFVHGDGGKEGATTECAVCLSEFEEGERGRLLPKCNHAFHAGCIDMWFQSHATCPICRRPVVDNPDSSSTSPAAADTTATATATATAIIIDGSESSRDSTRESSSGSPIQVASYSSLDLAELEGSPHPAAPVVIIVPRLEEEGSSASAADGPSSARSSFHSVIDVPVSFKEQQPEPKSPVVAKTMERLRSLGRLLSRRDLGSSTQEQQLPSPRV